MGYIITQLYCKHCHKIFDTWICFNGIEKSFDYNWECSECHKNNRVKIYENGDLPQGKIKIKKNLITKYETN